MKQLSKKTYRVGTRNSPCSLGQGAFNGSRRLGCALNEKKNMGYTGVLKLLQIMTSKGMVRRDETQRAHIYEARRPAEHTKRQLVSDMLQRVFEGSAGQLMMHALAGHRASRDEIDERRRILDAYKADDDGKPE